MEEPNAPIAVAPAAASYPRLRMRVAELRPHPLNVEIIGSAEEATHALLRESVKANGFLEDWVVTPPDAEDHPSCILNGNSRYVVAVELGIEEVWAKVACDLRTAVDQALYMFEVAKRKDFSPAARAAQLRAIEAVVAAAPAAWRRKRGIEGKRPTEIVALMTQKGERAVYRLKKVFHSKTSTDALRRAVTEKRIGLVQAERLICEVESEYEPGSEAACAAVDAAVARDLANGHPRSRAPRTPAFRPGSKPVSVLHRMQREIVAWAQSEIGPNERAENASAIERATAELVADVRRSAADFQRKVRRLGRPLPAPDHPRYGFAVVNRALTELGLPTVARLSDVNVSEVKSIYRKLARLTHPDATDAPGMREHFERIHSAYEQVMEICERRGGR